MQNNVFLRLAQERYTTKHYNGQQIPSLIRCLKFCV
jgi:nitroreductase/dihydropteridine reductase